jgi:polysaccharide biosynthesis/export protein
MNNTYRKSKIRSFFYLALLFSLLYAPITFGQKIENLSDEQVREFIKRAETSGMSEAEIEKYALARGYTAADVVKLKDRIAQIKGGGKKVNAESSDFQRMPRTVNADQNNETEKIGEKPIIKPEDREPKEIEISNTNNRHTGSNSLAVFGSNLFAKSNLAFEPNLRIPTPKNYILGPDDELIIDVYGNSQMTYKTKISPEGTIKIDNLAPIFVNGLTIEQASDRTINRMKSLYYGLNTQGGGVYAQVTLGNIRSIKVTVIGEVKQPGTYTVPSLATVFNVLYQAGGPSSNGSYRNITLLRDNKVIRTIDLYDFLLKADQTNNIQVKDQDVIKINDYDKRVYVNGEVKRPAIYEVKKGENLKTIISYAGNFSEKAYTKFIKLKRYTETELKIIEINKEQFASFLPEAGDKYQVDSVLNTYENRVTVRGAVKRPGEFALGQNGVNTVKELLNAAEGLRDDAFKNRATITRLNENLEPVLIAIDLNKLLAGQTDDIKLQKEDMLEIVFVQNLKEKYTVSIYGQVNKPEIYDYKENMTIADLITTAGGFKDAAMSSKIELSRRVKYDSSGTTAWQTIKISEINIDENLKITDLDTKITLKPFDVVSVKSAPRYNSQKNIILVGEVVYPGYYILKDNEEKLSDIIHRAGGIKPSAFLKGGRIYRGGQIVSVNFENAINNPSSIDNISIIKSDSIHIPKVSQTVEIVSGVYNPALVAYKTGEGLKKYISKAGGLVDNAILKKSFVIYPNGESDRAKSFLWIKKYPKIEPGSQIIVPIESAEKKNRISGPELTSMTTAIISAASIILTTIKLFQ